MNATTLLLAAGITAITFLSASRGSAGPDDAGADQPADRDGDTYEPPSNPAETVAALQDVLLGLSKFQGRERLGKLLRERMTVQVDQQTWQIGFPVDLEGTLSFDRMTEVCRTISEAYRTPITLQRTDVRGVPFALVTIGPWTPADPDLSWLDQEQMGARARYGGLVDLVVNTVVASAVGTVTSMGVQDLVHSMGGERRLARTMRHYRAAEARGDGETANRIKQKILRSASRIKGRKVNWAEVERLAQSAG